ncbi:histidine kinase [Staphylococcus aureus]
MQTIQYLITLSPKLAQTVVQQLSQMLRLLITYKLTYSRINEELNYIEQYVGYKTCVLMT